MKLRPTLWSAPSRRRGPTIPLVLGLVAALVMSSAEVVVTPTAAVATPAADPRDVAVLGSPATPAERPSARPAGDFAPLTTTDGPSHFDPKRSRVVARSTFAEEYENPDGTRTVRQSTAPLNVQDASGAWQPVDNTLRVDGKSKRANADHHPLTPSLAGRADDGAVLALRAGEHKVSLALDRAGSATAKVDGDKVGYADVAPGTDLDYEVTSNQVKETIKLKRPPSTSSWRFRLDAGGLTPRVVESGAVLLTDAADEIRLVIPPVETWDSSGSDDRAPALTGGTYALERDGTAWWLTVSVDPAWLHDPARVYPVSVDPTFTLGVRESHAYRSDGTTCDNCGLRIGNSLANGDTYNRSWFYIDYASLLGKTVVGARLDVSRDNDTTGSIKTWPAGLFHASDRNFGALGQNLGTALVGDVGSFGGATLTSFLRSKVDARDTNVAFMLTGAEQPGTWTYKHLDATLVVDTGTAAPAPALASPADGSVLTTLTPTLAVSPVSDPDGDKVTYCFKVATGSDAQSGVVVDSGCLPTPSWSVPQGVLQDGVNYTWRASAFSGSTVVTPTWVGHLKVDQRIGDHGPSPVDNVGPVAVNLANGNVSLSEATPTFTTVGGTAGLTFGYNSQQREARGLRASYFEDLSHNGIINPSQQPVLVRTEPQVNVDYGAESPFAPALPADYFVVRWEGFFQAPVAGSYQFAGVHDDGAEVFVNGAKVYDGDQASDLNWTQATGVALTAGQRVAIKVELQEITGLSRMRLFTRTSDGAVPVQVVPSDWLFSSDLPALPQGWTLSADLDGTGGGYTTAQVTDQNVVLTDATGAKHTYAKKSTGGYAAPEGEDGVLALDTAGLVTVQEGGSVFTFRADGKLATQSSAADSRKPAALQNVYDGGTPSRLVQIKDPVSGRAQVLRYNRSGDDCYGGATPPAGSDAAPPAQMLCRVSYWDGTETRLWYTAGKLSRVEDPGSEVTDYGYNAAGLLDRVRTSQVNDWVAVDPANRAGATEVLAAITYDGASDRPKATAVTAPAPALGKPRPAHAYRYDPANRQSFVDTAGLSPATGFSSRLTYDDADRLLTTTDATGRTTAQSWSAKDQVLTSTDPAGRVSTTVYDHADRVADKYGPAPAECFSGQVPTSACAATVPHSHTGYDEGVNGLSASFYDNTSLSGAPMVFSTGVGTATGTLAGAWGWERGHPPGLPNDVFSARFTGEIVFPAAGEYTLRAFVDDGVRLWLDDQLVIDDWKHVDTATWRQAKTTSAAAGTAKRVRLDYLNDVG
ncbi:MAG TPA: PA14 domain-containing protein, partial [Umezawaea sp.]|nr:PA14 domain-containing protein [Umezawaea sp.]